MQGAGTSQHYSCPHTSLQGTNITNSDGSVVTMLLTPCTAADQHAGSPRRPSGRNGTSRPADNTGAWHQRRTGTRHGAVPITICSVGGTRIKEKKGSTVLEAFVSFALLPLSLCVTCSSPSSIKGEAGRPRSGRGRFTTLHGCRHHNTRLTRFRSTRTSETWDLSLSRSFLTPTTNFQC